MFKPILVHRKGISHSGLIVNRSIIGPSPLKFAPEATIDASDILTVAVRSQVLHQSLQFRVTDLNIKHENLFSELAEIRLDDGVFVMFKLFDNLDESFSLLEMFLFGEVFCTDSELVDSFAVVEVEPELDVVFVAEKVRFDLTKMVYLVSG